MSGLKAHKKSMKVRFSIWLVLSILFLLCFVHIFFSGFSLDTNIMNLLPSSQQNPVVEKASNKFTHMMGNQLIFLIGNTNKIKAEKAATLFYDDLKKSVQFEKINYLINTSDQQAWAGFYFPYRMSLLTSIQKKLLLENNIQQIEKQALFSLYSPLGVSGASLLADDPFFLFQNYITSMPKPVTKLTLSDQRLMVKDNNQWYVMITAQIKGESFSLSTQKQTIGIINSAEQNVRQEVPNTHILKTGMLFYAKAGADSAQRDISTIGIGSIIGIILLVFFTFRSLSPLFYTLMSCAIGFVAAFVITYYLFGTVYLFTLVFGVSLIGICVDYAFFYYADQLLGGRTWTSTQGLRNIFPGVTLGLLNVVLAFIIISFTPFPGLKQLAVFAISGLTMAYLTVVCAFPLLLKAKVASYKPPLLKVCNHYLRLWQEIPLKAVVIVYVVVAIVSVIGIYKLKANDNIRILESSPAHLKQEEAKIRNTIGNHMSNDFYIVFGNTAQEVLNHEKSLTDKLNQVFPNIDNKFIAVSTYLPSVSTQKENYRLVKDKLINETLINYLQKIGVKKQKASLIYKQLSDIKFKPLTIKEWISSPVSKALSYLWLGKINNSYASVVLLSTDLDSQRLQHLAQALPFVTYVNKPNEVSNVFQTYRQIISYLLLAAYVLLFVFLTIRYSIKKSLLYFLPPVGACLLSLAALGWFAVPLTLFNILALILVLGIGVDYVLFFAETRAKYESTMLAVSLSAITTCLSFGLLALSATPVIHYFGVTILVGILSAFLLSPLAVRVPSKYKGKR